MLEPLAGIFPQSFLAIALAHFLALLSPGPDFFLILGTAGRKRFAPCVPLCFGIAAGNAVYIALSLAGWSIVRYSPLLYRALELAGAVYLAWLGLALYRSRKQALGDVPKNSSVSGLRYFGIGFASAALNPKNAVFYMTLVIALSSHNTPLIQQVSVGIWMLSVVLLWDLMLAAWLVSLAKSKRLPNIFFKLESFSGVALMILSVIFLIRPLLEKI